MKKICSVALIGAALAFGSGARAAAGCHLGRVATLTLTPRPNGHYTIPVSVNGVERPFVLYLNSPFSLVSARLSDAQGLKPSRLSRGAYVSNVNLEGGESVKSQVKIDDFQVGPVHIRNLYPFRYEQPLGGDDEIGGAISLDVLDSFDVELNFAEKKLSLFSQDHCEGKVVYWAPDYAAVPFKRDEMGHLTFSMTLDGKDAVGVLDVMDGPGWMKMETAGRLFDLREDSPNMSPAPDGGPDVFRYPFRLLSVGGIMVSNPAITIHKGGDGGKTPSTCDRPHRPVDDYHFFQCFGGVDLEMRGSVLSKLHLYFAFAEKMLYVTPADMQLGKAP
jgi:hypothetical protein